MSRCQAGDPRARRAHRPALLAARVPLAPASAGDIPAETWDAWLRGALKADIGDEAFKQTRSTLQTALADAGVLTITGARVRHTRAPTSISNIPVKVRSVRPDIVEKAIEVQEALYAGALPDLEAWARIDSSTRAASLSVFQECLPDSFEQEFLRSVFLDVDGARRWAGEVEVGLTGAYP